MVSGEIVGIFKLAIFNIFKAYFRKISHASFSGDFVNYPFCLNVVRSFTAYTDALTVKSL